MGCVADSLNELTIEDVGYYYVNDCSGGKYLSTVLTKALCWTLNILQCLCVMSSRCYQTSIEAAKSV